MEQKDRENEREREREEESKRWWNRKRDEKGGLLLGCSPEQLEGLAGVIDCSVLRQFRTASCPRQTCYKNLEEAYLHTCKPRACEDVAEDTSQRSIDTAGRSRRLDAFYTGYSASIFSFIFYETGFNTNDTIR